MTNKEQLVDTLKRFGGLFDISDWKLSYQNKSIDYILLGTRENLIYLSGNINTKLDKLTLPQEIEDNIARLAVKFC